MVADLDILCPAYFRRHQAPPTTTPSESEFPISSTASPATLGGAGSNPASGGGGAVGGTHGELTTTWWICIWLGRLHLYRRLGDTHPKVRFFRSANTGVDSAVGFGGRNAEHGRLLELVFAQAMRYLLRRREAGREYPRAVLAASGLRFVFNIRRSQSRPRFFSSWLQTYFV